MKDFTTKLILVFLFLSGLCFAQQGIDMEDLAGWYGSEEMLKPVLSIEDSVCQGEIVLVNCTNCSPSDGLFWAVQGNGEIIRKTGTLIEIFVVSGGSIRISLERENYWGIGRQSKTVEALEAPYFALSETASLCEDDTLELNLDARYASYVWLDGNEGSERQITQQGIYGVKVMGQNGCSSSKKIHVRTKSLPSPALGPDRFTCNTKRPQLFPGHFTSYFWQNGSKDSVLAADFPGTYWVRVTDGCGQQATDTVKIIDKKLPPIELGGNQVLCAGDTLILDAGDDYGSYRWNTGFKGNTLPAWSSATYAVSASDESGCIVKAEIRMEVVPCSEPLTMPLRISPNGDQLNEQFILLDQQEASSLSMQVFSQDGLLLFFSDQKNQGWNGTFNQSKVSAGTYPYTIQYRDSAGKQQYLTGIINVE